MRTILSIAAAMFAFASVTRADIFQWEYINPADPSQGKQQSTTLAPNGAGVDAVPVANLSSRNLTMGYLIGADLRNVNGNGTNLANADLSQANLTNVSFRLAALAGANFSHANLTNACFGGATLAAPNLSADFTGAEIRGAWFGEYDFSGNRGIGITSSQLYSTATYQAHDLSGIDFSDNYLDYGNFVGQNLTNVSFVGARLSGADFSGAVIRGARFDRNFVENLVRHLGSGITLAQIYSTASYLDKDLRNVWLRGNDLTGGNFAQQNLTNASFTSATLTGADFREANLANASFRYSNLTDAEFAGADIRGTRFDDDSSCYPFFCSPSELVEGRIAPEQLYSTASYQAHDLSDIGLSYNYLAGANFAGQNLTNADLSYATLIDTDFSRANLTNAYLVAANLTGANLTAADMRGADIHEIPRSATTPYLILPDGHIDGPDLDAGALLIVHDYDGRYLSDPSPWPPIPITVDQLLTMAPGGTLRMVFEADAWDSTLSFAPGIPVALGGTLELTFAADVNLASQVGRTIHVFDWTGVTPTGAFAISSSYAWDLSNLYTTGEVTLTAVPEPCGSLYFSFALLCAFVAIGRVRLSCN